MKRIKELLLRFIYWICRLLPIDRKMIAFESEGDFCDNSRALYDYMLEHTTEYHFVWLVHKDITSWKESHTNNARTSFVYHNYRLHSLKDILILSCAKYIFYTHGLGLDFRVRKDQKVLNLWHGIPIKGIKRMSNKRQKPQFHYLLCLSEENAPFISKFLECDITYAIPLGYPRNDLLIKHKGIGRQNPFVPTGFNGKVVIWMPTFRKSWNKIISEDNCDNETGLPLLETATALQGFNSFLSSINTHLIVKIHHLQAQKDAFKYNLSNIVFVQDEDILSKQLQLYQIIAKTDALLTDYSSVFIDYLLIDRPIGFILDDMEKYKNNRGEFLYSPITDLMAGTHIYNIKQLKDFFSDIATGVDNTKGIRNAIRRKMIKYHDGNSCERIATFLRMNIDRNNKAKVML